MFLANLPCIFFDRTQQADNPRGLGTLRTLSSAQYIQSENVPERLGRIQVVQDQALAFWCGALRPPSTMLTWDVVLFVQYTIPGLNEHTIHVLNLLHQKIQIQFRNFDTIVRDFDTIVRNRTLARNQRPKLKEGLRETEKTFFWWGRDSRRIFREESGPFHSRETGIDMSWITKKTSQNRLGANKIIFVHSINLNYKNFDRIISEKDLGVTRSLHLASQVQVQNSKEPNFNCILSRRRAGRGFGHCSRVFRLCRRGADGGQEPH